MSQYRVSWEIDIEAGSPEQAAKQALAIQRDSESTATVFEVRMVGPCPSCHQFAVHQPKCRIAKRDKVRLVDQPQPIDLGDQSL